MRVCLTCGGTFPPGARKQAWRCTPCQRAKEAGRPAHREAYSDPVYRAYRGWVRATRPACWLCGEPGADTVDHVVPLASGGTNERSNLKPAHLSCNSAAGGRWRGPGKNFRE